MKTDTPETDQMRISFYEGGGQEPDIFELCEKLERERNLEMGYRGEWCDKARKAESQLDELDVLREKAEKAHEAFYTMRCDWKSCDFELPALAIIHMEAITKKMKEMGKVLFYLENVKGHPRRADAQIDQMPSSASDAPPCSISSFLLEGWHHKAPVVRVMKWLAIFNGLLVLAFLVYKLAA